MDEYTPTTDEVKAAYRQEFTTSDDVIEVLENDAEFDRWLRAELARAWDEGAVEALERIDNGYDSVLMNVNPYRAAANGVQLHFLSGADQ